MIKGIIHVCENMICDHQTFSTNFKVKPKPIMTDNHNCSNLRNLKKVRKKRVKLVLLFNMY